MDSSDTAGIAESAPATPGAETDTSAGTQNTDLGQTPAPQTPWNQHPDWQRMVRQRDEARAESQRHGQTLTQLQREIQTLKQTAQAPAGTPQERFEKQQAGEALKSLIAEHPELKPLLDLAKAAPGLMQRMQGVDSLRQAQEQALHRQGREHIGSLVKAENLPTGDKFVRRIENLVAAEIAEIEGGRQRYLNGDLSVIKEAFDAIKPDFLALLQRNSQQGVIDAKQRTQKLPPASTRGGGPGQDPPMKLDAEKGDPKKFMNSLGDRAAALLGGRG